MKIATKDRSQHEDEEADRLVRKAPKQKPPRRDTRRERVHTEQDPDLEGDPDLKNKDKSLNFKIVGAVSRRYKQLQRALKNQQKPQKQQEQQDPKDRIPARSRETGEVVNISPATLKDEPGKYEKLDPEEAKAQQAKKPQPKDEGPPKEIKDQVEDKPDLAQKIKVDPNLPAADFFPGIQLPEGMKTLGDVGKALAQAGESKKQAPKKDEPESGAKEEAPKPGAEKAPGEGAPPEKEKEAPKEPPQQKLPTAAEKHNIPQPTRREASSEEYAEANLLLADTFPPKMAAKLIAQKIHPGDARELVDSFRSARTKKVPDLPAFIDKVSGLYQTDPDKVEPPTVWKNTEGEKVAFDTLDPDEKADAYRKYQMQVLGASIAATQIVSDKLSFPNSKGDPTVPQSVRKTLAHVLISKTTEDSSDLDEQVFRTALKSPTVELSPHTGKKLLEALSSNPLAEKIGKSFLFANDYLKAKKDFLKSEAITEHGTPAEIAVGLMQAKKFFQERAASYGFQEHRGQERFERKVLQQLKELNPEKYVKVRKAVDQVERRDYDKAKKAYAKAFEAWAHKPVESRGFAPTPPVVPIGISNAKTDEELHKESQDLWEGLFESRGPTKTASRVAYRHVISSYLKGNAMGTDSQATPKLGLYHGIDPAENYPQHGYPGWQQRQLRDLNESDYDGILASAKEWLKNPVLTGLEPDQKFRNALDLVVGKVDIQVYNTLLARLQGTPEPGLEQSGGLTVKQAKATPDRDALEKMVFAKFPPDSRQKSGNRLTVMLTGPTAKALRRDAYETVALADLKDSELQKLADTIKVKTAKTAGFSFAEEKAYFLFYGKGPFNRDVTEALHYEAFPFKDDEGKSHTDVAMKIDSHKSSGIVTRADEMQGLTAETLVSLSIPEGSEAGAFKAAQKVARKHNLEVEKSTAGYTPKHRKTERPKSKGKAFPFRASSYRSGDGMTLAQELRQLAVKVAAENPSFGYDLLSLARKADKQQKTAAVSAPSAPSTQFTSLKATIIKTAREMSPEARTTIKPILQALKDLG